MCHLLGLDAPIVLGELYSHIELPQYRNLYHGSLYHDMSVYRDIVKSDEITVDFIIAICVMESLWQYT